MLGIVKVGLQLALILSWKGHLQSCCLLPLYELLIADGSHFLSPNKQCWWMGSPLFHDLIHFCSVVGPNYYMRPLYHVTNASAHSTLLTVPADFMRYLSCNWSLFPWITLDHRYAPQPSKLPSVVNVPDGQFFFQWNPFPRLTSCNHHIKWSWNWGVVGMVLL